MRVRPTRRPSIRRRTGAAILATAVASLGLVTATSSVSSAAPVSTAIKYSCGARGGDAATVDALTLAAGLIGSNRLGIDVTVSAADIPDKAGLDEEINAQFKWTATLDQALIDGAAALIPTIAIKNIKGSMNFTGPSSESDFTGTGKDITVRPAVGAKSAIDLGTYGGPITTEGGGILTYRMGTLQFDSQLNVSGVGAFDLKLDCSVVGTNLVAKTTVRDPDAPIFNPEVIALSAAPGETVTQDLLTNNITEGKTPLQPETLKIAEAPPAGTASITNGVFSYTAPAEPGTYSTTVEVCGAPKPDSGEPGFDEVQKLSLGGNWKGNLLDPRPVAFTLKVGDEETPLIWTAQNPIFPMPLNGTVPTADNWAPTNRVGLINDYALLTNYKAPTEATITAALEGVPSIGAGNVAVVALKENADRPEVVTGFQITYVGERAKQDIGEISLGQWYTVPPQEVLDSIGAAINEVAGSLGGDGEGEGGEPGPTPSEVLGAAPGVTLTAAQADAYIGNKLAASITGGPAVTDEEFEAWITIRVVDPIIAAVPDIIAFINGLFPSKPFLETLTQGEAPTPPPPLCAQAIIDVTVTEVLAETATNDAGTGTPAVAADQRGQRDRLHRLIPRGTRGPMI